MVEGCRGEIEGRAEDLFEWVAGFGHAFGERGNEFEAFEGSKFGEGFACEIEEVYTGIESQGFAGEEPIKKAGADEHTKAVTWDFDGEEATGDEEPVEFVHIFAGRAMAAEGIEGADDVERTGGEILIRKEAIMDGGIERFSGVIGGNAGGFNAFNLPFGKGCELPQEESGSGTDVEQASSCGQQVTNACGVTFEAFAAGVNKGGFGDLGVWDVFFAEIGFGFVGCGAFGNVGEAAAIAGDDGEVVADTDETVVGGATDRAVDARGRGLVGSGSRR